ncbi:hypothetical protein DPEC_G00229080 [Dallia pectoralis]|uniref:Uncharacterized protein n=1 Tax=Dallia pectoralis TaxID=75939 RepID=A0ACC2G1S3_DALPE|nr:hypothetical protein DPEC_G00229080 [Dallia pectoralis]
MRSQRDVEANRQDILIQTTGETAVSDYLCWSILNLIFCCWPLGIGAVVQSRKALKKLAKGDVAAAQSASDCAFSLNVGSLFCGVILLSIYAYVYYGHKHAQ